jgi:peptide/nickel transport system permease protein
MPAGILAVLVFVSLAPGLVAPYDPLEMTLTQAFKPPSRAHLFGTDEFGRDLFSRIVYGTRVSVGIAAMVVMLASLIGVPLGLLAGYFGGVTDSLIMRLVDVILAFPAILLALSLITILGQGAMNGMIAVVVVSIPAFARLVRAGTLQQQAQEYVLAARAIGAGDSRIMLRTILPNCLSAVLVQAAIAAGVAVLLEAALSFLGLGVVPPAPSLGQMLNTGRLYMYRAPWYGIFPGIALTALVLSLNLLADTAQKLTSHGKIL